MTRTDDDGRIAQLDHAQTQGVQSLLLRRPPGPAVRHLLLCVPPGKGLDARKVLQTASDVSFGIPDGSSEAICSLGFTFAGLDALRLPAGYLRVFQRLAPSFRTGAVRRSTAVGDAGASSAANWEPSFAQDRAHVIVSWHGPKSVCDRASQRLVAAWQALAADAAPASFTACEGELRGAPPGEEGQWEHFGFRDDVSDLAIDRVARTRPAPDLRQHAAGALLLGWIDDEGLNRFSLPRSPDRVRRFMRDASFGILRKMAQDVDAFEAQARRWQSGLTALYAPRDSGNAPLDPGFAKAKLCGRWPDGRALRPGARVPPASRKPADYRLDLHTQGEDGRFATNDAQGAGCPFGSHVRRMQAHPDGHGHLLRRPLLRRSMPYAEAPASAANPAGALPGQWGHFFCADIENQFEHLLGQWAARPPVGAAARDDALDPFAGLHDDPEAGLVVALADRPAQRLTGFRPWTTALGMAYAWYPGRVGLTMLLENDFVPDELAGPWL